MIKVYLQATVTDMRRAKPNANPNAYPISSSVHIVMVQDTIDTPSCNTWLAHTSSFIIMHHNSKFISVLRIVGLIFASLACDVRENGGILDCKILVAVVRAMYIWLACAS